MYKARSAVARSTTFLDPVSSSLPFLPHLSCLTLLLACLSLIPHLEAPAATGVNVASVLWFRFTFRFASRPSSITLPAKLPHHPRRLAYRSGSRPSTTRLPCLIPRLYWDDSRDLTARLSESPVLGLSPLTSLPPALRPSALSDKERSHQFFVPDPWFRDCPE